MGAPSYLRPIELGAFEPTGDGLVVCYSVSSHGEPNFELERVEVTEAEDVVTVTLYERVNRESEKAAKKHLCLELTLQGPLGERVLRDGSTGEDVPRLDRSAGVAEEHWFLASAADRGCRRWSEPVRLKR